MLGRMIWRDRAGSVAVEAAMIVPMFLLLILGTLELGIMLFDNAALDGAARAAARTVRTGQVQLSGSGPAIFQSALCAKLTGIIDCNAVAVDVRAFPSFGALSLPPLANPAAGLPSTVFDPGDAGQIVAVRALYHYGFIVPMIGTLLSGDGRWLVSTVIFRNEPFRAGS